MKRLTPEVFISNHLLECIDTTSHEAIAELAMINATTTIQAFAPVLYNSDAGGAEPFSHTIVWGSLKKYNSLAQHKPPPEQSERRH